MRYKITVEQFGRDPFGLRAPCESELPPYVEAENDDAADDLANALFKKWTAKLTKKYKGPSWAGPTGVDGIGVGAYAEPAPQASPERKD